MLMKKTRVTPHNLHGHMYTPYGGPDSANPNYRKLDVFDWKFEEILSIFAFIFIDITWKMSQ